LFVCLFDVLWFPGKDTFLHTSMLCYHPSKQEPVLLFQNIHNSLFRRIKTACQKAYQRQPQQRLVVVVVNAAVEGLVPQTLAYQGHM
jgi:Ni,Fe-hydrogenase III small subunit